MIVTQVKYPAADFCRFQNNSEKRENPRMCGHKHDGLKKKKTISLAHLKLIIVFFFIWRD